MEPSPYTQSVMYASWLLGLVECMSEASSLNPSLEFAIRAIRDEATKPLHVEIERLQQRVKDLEEEVRRETESRFSLERAADEPSGRCTCEHGIPNDRDCAVHGAQLRKEDGACERSMNTK